MTGPKTGGRSARMLMELADRMRKEEIALVFAGLSADLKDFLSDFGVLEVVGSDRVFASVDAALAAFRQDAERPASAEDVVKT